MRRLLKIALWVAGAAVVLAAAGYGIYYGLERYEYPYGRTHRCTRMLWFDLRQYAEEHDGKYPAGEATPEASLSLLYRTNHVRPEDLAGRAKSAEVARKILESGGLLGPDTCDWHYVEGLTLADEWDIAIMWDKSSLGHTGQRLHGGHEVMRLMGIVEVIPAEKWDEFLAEQKELLARRSPQAKEGRPALTARIRMPDGTIVDNVSGRCALKNEFRSPTSSGSGTQTGGLSRTDLTWGLAEVENGTSTYVLSIAGLVSEPVTVEWRNGTANPDNILFRMRPKR
jgi:hypothetical protein